MKYAWYILVTLAVLASAAWAQSSPRALRVGVGLNAYRYQGDLTFNDGEVWRLHPGMNLALQFEPRQPLHFQFNAGFGEFIEQLDQRTQLFPPEITPNDFVRTEFFYLDLRLRYILWRRGPIQPYLGLGGGLIFFTPFDQDGNFLSDNTFSRLPGETFGTFAFQLPLGVGLDYQLNSKLGLGLAYNLRFLGSDYLDNLGQAGMAEGNDRLDEWSISLQLTIGGEKPEKEAPVIPPTPDTLSAPGPLFSFAYWNQLYPELTQSEAPAPLRSENQSFLPASPRANDRELPLPKNMTWNEAATHFQTPLPYLRNL
ncbi:MAG: outer membrane beta-barrel protein, partial [Bacteroidota bacterium]